MKNDLTLSFSEWILVFSGFFFLVSTLVISGGGDFIFNFLAKAVYVIGVVIFLIKN